MDGRNPAPPKKPWNDDSPLNTNKQWLLIGFNVVRTDFIHPQYDPWQKRVKGISNTFFRCSIEQRRLSLPLRRQKKLASDTHPWIRNAVGLRRCCHGRRGKCRRPRPEDHAQHPHAVTHTRSHTLTHKLTKRKNKKKRKQKNTSTNGRSLFVFLPKMGTLPPTNMATERGSLQKEMNLPGACP